MKCQTCYLLTFIFSALLFTACGEDDEAPKNEITFNGTTYAISAGVIEDYGVISLNDGVNGGEFYNYDFSITDGAFVFDSEGFLIDLDASATVWIFGFLVTEAPLFDNGTYVWPESNSLPDDPQWMANFFLFNSDGVFVPVSGDLNVRGQDLNRRLTYNMELFNSSDSVTVSPPTFSMRGSYSGTFDYVDLTGTTARMPGKPQHWEEMKRTHTQKWLRR